MQTVEMTEIEGIVQIIVPDVQIPFLQGESKIENVTKSKTLQNRKH